jgi:hypothetical protein
LERNTCTAVFTDEREERSISRSATDVAGDSVLSLVSVSCALASERAVK